MLRIKEIRKAQRMSVQELADAAGLSFMSIYRYEAGTRMPKFTDALKIAKVLGVSVYDLIERKDGTR